MTFTFGCRSRIRLCVLSITGSVFTRISSTIAKIRLRPLEAATAATINTIACVNIENATMPMKIISSFEFPDESEPASCNHIPDITIRAASMQPLSQYRDFGPAHIFHRIARPVLQTKGALRRVSLVSRAHVGFLAGIDRSHNLILLLLHQSLALLNILGPLRPSALLVLLAAIHILVHLLLALLCKLGRAFLALLSQNSGLLLGLERARDQVFARLFACLGRIQHSNECAEAQPCEKPSPSAYTILVVRHLILLFNRQMRNLLLSAVITQLGFKSAMRYRQLQHNLCLAY